MVGHKEHVNSRFRDMFSKPIKNLNRRAAGFDLLVEQMVEKHAFFVFFRGFFRVDGKSQQSSVFADFFHSSFRGSERIFRERGNSDFFSFNFKCFFLSVVKTVDLFDESSFSDRYNGIHEIEASEVSKIVHISKENSEMFSSMMDCQKVFGSFLTLDHIVFLGDNRG